MSAPLLSICIPTYNRAGYLRDALGSIALQIESNPRLKEEIEVVVADNASTDDTEATVSFFTDAFAVTYVKNPTNVGFDGNVNISVRAARGNYCWYLGDDDAIVNGALAPMADLCRKGEYAVISLRDRPITERPTRPQARAETYSPADYVFASSPSESYLRGHLPSALSMLVFRRSDWLSCADFNNHTPGWFYFETILKMAALPGEGVLHIAKPMVLTGQDMRWADGGAGLKIFVDCNRFLRRMPEWGYDKEMIAQELAHNARQFPRVLLQAKARGLAPTRAHWSLVKRYLVYAPWHVGVVSSSIFFVPNALIRLARSWKRRLKGG